MMFKTYNVQGDVRQLEFSIELIFLGHSSSISALNFDDFLRTRQKDGERFYGQRATTSNLVDNEEEEEGILLERRKIRWQEAIPRPTFEEGRRREERDEVEEEEGNDEKDDEEEEKVPEDPVQKQIIPKLGSGRRKSISISHRIFTIIETEMPLRVEMVKYGQIEGQRIVGQHFGRKRIGQIEQTSLKEPIRLNQSAQREKRFVPISMEKMRIMAYLGEVDGNKNTNSNKPIESEEYLLWEICLENGRFLRVQPDIGKYLVPSRRGIFSATLTINEIIQFDNLAEYQQQQNDFEEEPIEQVLEERTFEVPEGNGEYWLHFMVEIAKARNFASSDNLRVEWMLELPANIQLIQPEMARGQTQQCGTKAVARDDIAHIGHLFQFTLNYNASSGQREGERRATDWPMLLFRIISEDSWARFFLDGYACLPLPSEPGINNVQLDCWRPINGENSKICALKNAHLGQSVDLRHFGLAGPKDSDGNWSSIYSREGMTIESTGTLVLIIRCIHQCKHFMARDVLNSLKYTKMIQGLHGSLHFKIAKVLEEFERARRQLMALRAQRAKAAKSIHSIQNRNY